MTAKSNMRGHEIYGEDGAWYYVDDDTPALDNRPCKRCGKHPTKEGFDHCLGFIPGMAAVCCGHGVSEPEMMVAPDTWGLDD